MTKYTKEFRIKVVRAYIDRGMGQKTVGRLFGVHTSMVRKWLDQYQLEGEAGLEARERHRSYAYSFKKKVLQAVLDEGISHREAAKRFRIHTTSLIAQWLRIARDRGIDALQLQSKGRPPLKTTKRDKAKPPPDDKSKSYEQLIEENEQLRAEVAYLKKRRALTLQKATRQVKPESSQD